MKTLLAFFGVVGLAAGQDGNKLDLDRMNRDLDAQLRKSVQNRIDTAMQARIDAALQAVGAKAARRQVSGDVAYDAGSRSLDDHKYDEAIQRFNSVIDAKSARADGAMYWRAYALNRMGRSDEALAALAALQKDYPQSRWRNDAQALEVEVKQRAGRPVAPGEESNEDLKLMAINSLMNAEPDRAIPLLEGILKGPSAPRVKDRAMFVLTQSKSPKAHQILLDFAKGAGNPDQQLRAVRYVGMSGTTEAQAQLVSIYRGSGDMAVKKEALRALMTANGRDPIFTLAKAEKDGALFSEAVRLLGALRATDQLSQLYASAPAADEKLEIIRSFFVAGATEKLTEIARTEKDTRLRGEALRNLAVSPSTQAGTLQQLYQADGDVKVRREIVNGLFARGSAKALVDLSRGESDPVMKKYIVERLSMMHSKEATDYMMELLK